MATKKLEIKKILHDVEVDGEYVVCEVMAFGERIGEVEIQLVEGDSGKRNQYLVTWRNLAGVKRGKDGDMSSDEFEVDAAIIQEGQKDAHIIQVMK